METPSPGGTVPDSVQEIKKEKAEGCISPLTRGWGSEGTFSF
jgi:hypothetical protein